MKNDDIDLARKGLRLLINSCKISHRAKNYDGGLRDDEQVAVAAIERALRGFRKLEKRVKELEERLECNRVYRIDPENPDKFIREDVEPGTYPDGIACRDATIEILEEEIERYRKRKNKAYEERNQVVALLAMMFESGIRKTDIEDWHPEWHNCVYIDLPTGQVSWHYHDSHADLFAHLPPYQLEYDGHTTEQKYERVKAMIDKLRFSVS